MPPSHPGPHPCLPERRQPAGAARRGPSPSAGPSGPQPRRSGASLLCGDRESAGGRGDSHPPLLQTPPHLSMGVTGQGSVWVGLVGGPWHGVGAQSMPLGGRMPRHPLGLWLCPVFGDPPGIFGDPQECDETDTPMGGVFTTLSMPFLLWGPWLYSQGYSSPTQYFHV